MTVLVDVPRWQWRGQIWAHLISDTSYDELHEFARRLGKRRLGFQGDHYDVDETDHRRALALGAEAVDSRELVRRLRGARLRNRGDKPTWERLGHWPSGVVVDDIQAGLDSYGDAGASVVSVVEGARNAATAATVTVLVDDRHLAILFDLEPGAGAVEVHTSAGLVWRGEPREDGYRSVEVFVRR